MPTATLTAPKPLSLATALFYARNPESAGPERMGRAMETLGRRAAVETCEVRLRAGLADGDDRWWRSREAVKAVRGLERTLGRDLTAEENGLFVVAMIDLMHDLV